MPKLESFVARVPWTSSSIVHHSIRSDLVEYTPEMTHDHHDDSCGHESHDHDHDHSHEQTGGGPQDNLFKYIDRGNVVALNASEDSGPGKAVIKPWHERTDETHVSLMTPFSIFLFSLSHTCDTVR